MEDACHDLVDHFYCSHHLQPGTLGLCSVRVSFLIAFPMKPTSPRSRCFQTVVLVATWMVPQPLVMAASLYSESFDSLATAKVLVNKLANADLAYVDYSSFIRDQSGGGGPVTVRIPEAPNRIAGSAATRGVLLNATYGGTARTINLLASATPGGAAVVFSGNYRMAFDM